MLHLDNHVKERLALGSVVASTLVIGAFAFWGGWARRWMSDDGLIVLRTVRNLAAGNGPVFNAGERVETNTSVLWQYLIWLVHAVTGARLEGIAIISSLVLSVAAMALGVWATACLHRAAGWVVFPAGALVYLVLPPARDFFTSGLEWGLSIFYLAVLWWLLTRWARTTDNAAAYWLAFAAGLSWLVRPELALYGGIVIILLLVGTRSWAARSLIVAAALPVPAAYQLFRMGYYGVLTPHTAVAKSATDAEWAKGMEYLGDFVAPYWLWLPLALFVALAIGSIVLYWLAAHDEQGRHEKSDEAEDPEDPRTWTARSVPVATAVFVGCALLHTLYVLRVGGDFMHGRMLLLPLFAALLPVFVVPLRGVWTAALSVIAAGWALTTVLRGYPVDNAYYEQDFNIVDERDFWTYATQRAEGDPPRRAEDFLHSRHMRGFSDAVDELADGEAFASQYLEDGEKNLISWTTFPRESGRTDPPTLYFLNLGMTGMSTPLDVRVLDNMGLATPLAARQPRTADGRIGHDKYLTSKWQLADSATDLSEVPDWKDSEGAKKARAALQDPDVQELFATFRAPLDWERFWKNVAFSLGKGRTLELSKNPASYDAR